MTEYKVPETCKEFGMRAVCTCRSGRRVKLDDFGCIITPFSLDCERAMYYSQTFANSVLILAFARRPMSQFLCLRDPHQCPPIRNVFSFFRGMNSRGVLGMRWPVSGPTIQSTPNQTLFAYCAVKTDLPPRSEVKNIQICLTFYILIYSCISVGLCRCRVSIFQNSNTQ